MHNRLITFLSVLVFLCFLSSSANVSAQAGGDDLVVVDIPYTSQDELSYLASHYDLWHVDPETRLAKVMLSRPEFQALSDLGYYMTLDEANTSLANTGLEILPGQRSGIPGHPCYRTVDETYASAEAIASAYPALASWIDIGDSWERANYGAGNGHDILVLVLTNKARGGDKAKILVNSGLHARELAPVELNMRFAEYLVTHYGTDADITWLLDYNEVHLLLVSNPDGRVQVETSDLLWRKNTNEDYCGPTSTSRGADLNRNFDFHWGELNPIPDECEYTYYGPSALSEPESQAISIYELALFEDQRGPNDSDPSPVDTTGIFIDLHSHGNFVLWPYGFDETSIAPNDTQLQTLGRKLAYFNGYYTYQANDFYAASGASDDYAYGVLGIAAYTIEMGTDFFQDCNTFEDTIYPDNLDTLLYAVKSARRPYQTPSGPDALDLTAPGGMIPFNQSFQVTATLDDTRYKNEPYYEPTQSIASARYSIDIPPWDENASLFTMQAVDGTFDAPNEQVTATVNPIGLTGGRHTLFVQGQDADGNWGAVSAVFFETEYGYYFPLSYR